MTVDIQSKLPTLDDVLQRQSQPPVCLFNYYIILRDRLAMETLLDFWLDVAQADLLFRRYNRHGRTKEATNQKSDPCLSLQSSDIITHMLLMHSRASLATSTTPKKPPPTQTEMIDTVERIYLRYIMPNAEKELHQLPRSMRDTIGHHFNSIEEESTLDNPMIYAEAKTHVHQLLQSTFPLFLRYKVFMNLALAQQMGRFIAGILLLLFGLSLEFSLIFLDIHPWQKRLWVKMIMFPLSTTTISLTYLFSRVSFQLEWVYSVLQHV
ncbi:hypothetical protein BDB01DRAFT_524513 [Pilobolus umbonatus]|nr:hypothetical protein BDB01DRAFT_524513 [Pilobolus umbonatus]